MIILALVFLYFPLEIFIVLGSNFGQAVVFIAKNMQYPPNYARLIHIFAFVANQRRLEVLVRPRCTVLQGEMDVKQPLVF